MRQRKLYSKGSNYIKFIQTELETSVTIIVFNNDGIASSILDSENLRNG